MIARKTRRREEKFARRVVYKADKAAKKARYLASLPPGFFEAKAARREKARRERKEKTLAMRAAGIEREGKGRSPRNVRKEKIALKLLAEQGRMGTGANAGQLGVGGAGGGPEMNRMARRMKGNSGGTGKDWRE